MNSYCGAKGSAVDYEYAGWKAEVFAVLRSMSGNIYDVISDKVSNIFLISLFSHDTMPEQAAQILMNKYLD